MINGNVTEFLNLLYSGEELFFEYKGNKYFLQGWSDENSATMVLDVVADTPFTGYIWKTTKINIRKCADAFLEAAIWNGEDFLRIENEVVWVDW